MGGVPSGGDGTTDARGRTPLALVVSVTVGAVATRRLPAGFPATTGAGDYETAIGKVAASGPVVVHPSGLEGDAQADRKHHGGPDKAVHAHFAQHLEHWGHVRGWPLAPGEIGENLLLSAPAGGDAPDERSICIGDVVAVGSALLQVSQPRIPCFKQAAALGLADGVRQVADSGRCGLYLRVLDPGVLQRGATVWLVERPNPGVTVADAHRFVHHARHDPALRARLAGASALGEDIRHRLGR